MSDIVRAYDMAPYSGSRDYERLADLACKDSIICVVDFEGQRDVARTNFMRRGEQELWSVSARGFGYITAFNRADFIALCGHRNVVFIEPAGELPDAGDGAPGRALGPESYREYDGTWCVECGTGLPRLRQAHNKIRCFVCQAEYELRQRHRAGI